MGKILLVDDEAGLRRMAEIMLKREGYEVVCAGSGEEALEIFEDSFSDGVSSFGVVITDLKMGGMSGLELLEEIKRYDRSVQVLLVTAFASTQSAVSAIKGDAYDYIEKPYSRESLVGLIAEAFLKCESMREGYFLRQVVSAQSQFEGMIGSSALMLGIYALIDRISKGRTSVLVSGESGTGKELVARAIHRRSNRSDKAFVAVNCGAIPSDLIESELFGYVKGAFTGADKDKVGLIEAADGGVLFLDEIGELPLSSQVKLLRCLQERSVHPVGSTQVKVVDVRVIAATNRDLREEVSKGRFREDLYYRLNVFEVCLPALRDRIEDLPLLVSYFLDKFCREEGKQISGLESGAYACLRAYHYPGNIRELENIIEHAVTLESGEMIGKDSLPLHLVKGVEEDVSNEGELSDFESRIGLETAIESLERRLLEKAIKRCDGNRSEAAKYLGISFRSFRYRAAKYGI